MPIYDLAQVFISPQRVVNKAYLHQDNRLFKGQRLTQSEQELVSLQLREREKGSDIYGLSSFLSDPIVTNIIIPIILEGLFALSAYAYKRVTSRDKTSSSKTEDTKTNNSSESANNNKDDNLKRQEFAGLIYPQARDIVSRIDGTAGIRIIEIYSKGEKLPEFRFDSGTKEYVKTIQNEYFLGEERNIRGALKTLHPSNNSIVIKRGQNDFVKAYLKEDDFALVRYEADRNTIITLTGRPLYKLGIETSEFSEFETYSVKLEKTKKSKAG